MREDIGRGEYTDVTVTAGGGWGSDVCVVVRVWGAKTAATAVWYIQQGGVEGGETSSFLG